MEQSDIVGAGAPVSEPGVPEQAAPPVEAVPTTQQQQPSSAAAEAEKEADTPDKPTFTTEEAARVVVALVRAHRNAGDVDLDEAIAVLDAAYPAPAVPDTSEEQAAIAAQVSKDEQAAQDEQLAQRKRALGLDPSKA
jgi:hypothetical protein